MLERMGWKKGSGLGKDQQGNLEFIQIRYKNNAVGLGFDRLKDNQWTETESNYNELLKNLNNSTEAEAASVKPVDSSKSLEEISKNSRARVHYKKFTKGKDVHKYRFEFIFLAVYFQNYKLLSKCFFFNLVKRIWQIFLGKER